MRTMRFRSFKESMDTDERLAPNGVPMSAVPILKGKWGIIYSSADEAGEPAGDEFWEVDDDNRLVCSGWAASDSFAEYTDDNDFTWIHKSFKSYLQDSSDEANEPEPEPF
jgi:hypothetical protein